MSGSPRARDPFHWASVCESRSPSRTEIAAPTSSPPFQVQDTARSLAKLVRACPLTLPLPPTTTPGNSTPPLQACNSDQRFDSHLQHGLPHL